MSNPSSFAEESEPEEIFSSSFPSLSNIEEGSESSQDLSDIKSFFEKIGNEDKFNENDLTNINLNQKDINENIHQIEIKIVTTKEYSKSGPILNEIEKTKELLKNIKNLENKKIRSLGYKKRISLSNLNNFFKNKSLDEIKQKTLEEIFESISTKNTYIIKTALELERKKGKTGLSKLNKLSLGKVFHLIGKYGAVEDFLKQKNKTLKKNQLKKYKNIEDKKEEEKPMEIE